MTKKSAGVLGGPVGGEIWGHYLPLLNPAFLWNGAGAERVK